MAKENNKANALAALLDSKTLAEAAEKAGITTRTLYTYIKTDVEFARAYKNAQDCLLLERMTTITEERKRAKDVLFEIAEDRAQPAAVRVKAAQAIIEDANGNQTTARNIAHNNVSTHTFGF